MREDHAALLAQRLKEYQTEIDNLNHKHSIELTEWERKFNMTVTRMQEEYNQMQL